MPWRSRSQGRLKAEDWCSKMIQDCSANQRPLSQVSKFQSTGTLQVVDLGSVISLACHGSLLTALLAFRNHFVWRRLGDSSRNVQAESFSQRTKITRISNTESWFCIRFPGSGSNLTVILVSLVEGFGLHVCAFYSCPLEPIASELHGAMQLRSWTDSQQGSRRRQPSASRPALALASTKFCRRHRAFGGAAFRVFGRLQLLCAGSMRTGPLMFQRV